MSLHLNAARHGRHGCLPGPAGLALAPRQSGWTTSRAPASTAGSGELTRGAPSQPALRAALDELLAVALPRIVHLVVTADAAELAELADLASLGLHLAPQLDLATGLADQMRRHSVQLAALAATLTSQQVMKYRAGTLGADPDAANRLAGSLTDLSVRLGRLGRPEDALTAIEEAVTIRRELARARPDAFQPDLATSLNSLCAVLSDLGQARGRADRDRRSRHHLPGAGPGPPRRVPARRGQVAEQPVDRPLRPRSAGGRADRDPGSRHHTPELARARPDRLARSLTNLSGVLGDLGRPEDRLTAIEEAVSIYRDLAAARQTRTGPSWPRH